MKKAIYIMFFTLALLIGCRKEQVQLKNGLEDCGCAKEISADFLIEEMTSSNTNFAKYTDTDSIFSDKNVRFKALEDGAEYKWYIGAEVINTKEVSRYFGNALVGQTLPITLVLRKKPNKICFPNDDGYDSIIRFLTISQLNTYDVLDTTFMEGKYRMKSPLLIDSVDITIDYRDYFISKKRIDIYNYDGAGSNCLQMITRGEVNYRQFWTFGETSVTQGDYLHGDAHNRLNGLVEMNFVTGGYANGNYNTELNQWKYKGRKL